jgi:hypothetical protein
MEGSWWIAVMTFGAGLLSIAGILYLGSGKPVRAMAGLGKASLRSEKGR